MSRHPVLIRSGGKKYVLSYKDGERDGYYQEFYPHGQLKLEGWYTLGLHQQQWLKYYPDGVVESDYYYLNDNYHNMGYDFDSKGNLEIATQYDNDKVLDLTQFNEKGEAITKKKKSGDNVLLEIQYASGKPLSKLMLTCGSFSNTVAKWFPDGKLFYTYELTNGKRHGEYRYNFPNGQVELHGNYIAGNREGRWEGFNFDGKKDYHGNYLQNEQDSTWTHYFSNGNISSITEFKNDERDGLSKQFGADGKLVLEKMYSNGDLLSYRSVVDNVAGEWIPFTKDASILVKYSNGKPAFEENFKNGELEGARRVYYSSGQIYSEFHYSLGDYAGTQSVYYANGKIWEKGEYKFDLLNGQVQWFNDNDTLNHVENYEMGLRQGKSIWYEKGVKVGEFNFWAGLPHE